MLFFQSVEMGWIPTNWTELSSQDNISNGCALTDDVHHVRSFSPLISLVGWSTLFACFIVMVYLLLFESTCTAIIRGRLYGYNPIVDEDAGLTLNRIA
jgi:hypothetical protein